MRALWSKEPSLLSQESAEKSARMAAERLLEAIECSSAEHGYKPDALNRREPDVDWVCRIGTKQFALEHTRIETFNKEFELGNLWRVKLASPIADFEAEMNDAFKGVGHFLLGVYDAPDRRCLATFIPHLKEWLLEKAPSLGESFPQNIAIKNPSKEEPFPAKVRLTRFPGPLPYINAAPNFMVQRMVLFDEVKECRDIVERAFRNKAPKLGKYKQRGVVSVLVLDVNTEMATGVIPIIFAARTLKEYGRWVDRVVTVERDERLWGLRIANAHTFIDRKLINRWWEYQPNTREIKFREHGD